MHRGNATAFMRTLVYIMLLGYGMAYWEGKCISEVDFR